VVGQPQRWPPRGYRRLELLADIAMGELSLREMAGREGVTQKELAEFRDVHATEVAEIRAALAGQLMRETAGLWITKKQNRLAEMQAEAEELRDYLAELRAGDSRWSRAHRDMLKAYLEIFRQAADELGAYPQRQAVPARSGQTVHYVIETDHVEALR